MRDSMREKKRPLSAVQPSEQEELKSISLSNMNTSEVLARIKRLKTEPQVVIDKSVVIPFKRKLLEEREDSDVENAALDTTSSHLSEECEKKQRKMTVNDNAENSLDDHVQREAKSVAKQVNSETPSTTGTADIIMFVSAPATSETQPQPTTQTTPKRERTTSAIEKGKEKKKKKRRRRKDKDVVNAVSHVSTSKESGRTTAELAKVEALFSLPESFPRIDIPTFFFRSGLALYPSTLTASRPPRQSVSARITQRMLDLPLESSIHYGVEWTGEQKERLLDAVARYGLQDITRIAANVPGHNALECAVYLNILRDSVIELEECK
jgi:hypothetical protein